MRFTEFGPKQSIPYRVRRTTGASATKTETPGPTDHLVIAQVLVCGKTHKDDHSIRSNGYPAELIAEWCCVSVQSAEHHKAGRRKPSNRVLKLFRLHRDGKVLGDAWEDYRIIDERLFGLDGKSIRPTDIALHTATDYFGIPPVLAVKHRANRWREFLGNRLTNFMPAISKRGIQCFNPYHG